MKYINLFILSTERNIVVGQSWSLIRKKLEQENICECLKGRIQYFATRYTKSHDSEGSVAVRVDGHEVLNSCFYDWQNKRYEELKAMRNANKKGFNLAEKASDNAVNQGGFDQLFFYEAFYIYQNQNIEKSITDENPIVRLYAILDKRIGKRRLEKLIEEVEMQPLWLQYFYKLRLQTEGILL